MRRRVLGRDGVEVSALGLGLMSMSDFYGSSDESEGLATIGAALDAGVTLLDTGDFYGSGANEMLLARALADRRRDDVVVSVKFGVQRDPAGEVIGVDNRPSAVKNALAQTLRRLRCDHVDVYRPARPDPDVPMEDTVGAVAEMVEAGWVRHIALSEVDAPTLRRAAAVAPIADVQVEYSLLSRGIEADLLPTARELGVGVTAYGVLARGLLSGSWSTGRVLAADDVRAAIPRFRGENLARNLELVRRLGEVAQSWGATVSQTAIAWVAAQGDDVVPVVGARRRDQLADTLAAADIALRPDELAAIEQAVPAGAAAGTRADDSGVTMLPSDAPATAGAAR